MGLLRRKIWKELRAYLVLIHGPTWCSDLLTIRAAIAEAQRSSSSSIAVGRKRERGGKHRVQKIKDSPTLVQKAWEMYWGNSAISSTTKNLPDPGELLTNAAVGSDVLYKLSAATWWHWHGGSTLIFWHWPKGIQRSAARDGMMPYIRGELPRHRHPARTPKREKFALYLPKLLKILDRRYVVTSDLIKSFADYFDVEKDDDIRMVYNGTSCGLNWALWAPNFWLPTSKSALRVLDYGYFSVDVDLGEMFLNFPLPELLRQYSGIDLTPFAAELRESLGMGTTDAPSFWVRWERCWMGLKPSPYMAIRFYYWAEEFARGNQSDPNNMLRWDLVVLNLPGDPAFDPSKPHVYKWDEALEKIAGDVLSFVDDLRVSGFSEERAWQIARQVTSRLQYLGIQDAPRKRRPPVLQGGAWAGAILAANLQEITKTVSQAKWDKAKAQIKSLLDVLLTNPQNLFCYKTLERIRGFLCHMAMTFENMVPFLKGLHMTLAGHLPGRDKDGWKLTKKGWHAYLNQAVEAGQMMDDEAY